MSYTATMSQFVYAEGMQPNTEKRRCHHGTSSPHMKKKKEVRAAMKSMNGQVQSKRHKAASVLLPKMGTKGMGTLLFYVIGSIMNICTVVDKQSPLIKMEIY